VSQQRELRNALGRFASGVTVVTTQRDGNVLGMTANSFVSVSLDPPLVLISVAQQAHLHAALTRAGRYGISVLAEHQKDLSSHFAGRGPDNVDFRFRDHAGIPLIEGALAHFVVTVTDSHPAGDHTLFIGRVEHFESHEGRPLIFHSGRYHQLENESVSYRVQR